MKPKQIVIIRHGQSQANIDKGMYEHTPDHLVNLTELGKEQCIKTGVKLNELLANKNVTVWSSPYNRARQTTELITSELKSNIKYKEDPRLREQDWGNFYTEDEARLKYEDRKRHSYFFYRIENGESGADVYDRISMFLETLYRDFSQDNWTDSLVISTHGITALVFLMRYFHWSYEQYEEAEKFFNCGFVVLELDEESERYHLSIDMREGIDSALESDL